MRYLKSFLTLISLFLIASIGYGIPGSKNFQVLAACPPPGLSNCLCNDRSDGLISTTTNNPVLFGNPSASCILKNQAAFAPFAIVTFEDLKTDYYDKANPAAPAQKVDPITGPASQTSIPLARDSLYLINGDLNISGNPGGNRTGVIFVTGKLQISQNLTYGGNTSGLVFIVKGDINIEPVVTQVNAILISSGTICSYYESYASPPCPNLTVFPPLPNSSQLIINGSLISLDDTKPMRLRRNLNDNNLNAEQVNYQPKYFVILKSLFSKTQSISTENTFYSAQL